MIRSIVSGIVGLGLGATLSTLAAETSVLVQRGGAEVCVTNAIATAVVGAARLPYRVSNLLKWEIKRSDACPNGWVSTGLYAESVPASSVVAGDICVGVAP